MGRPPINDTNSKTGLVGIGPIPGQSPVASFNLSQIENLLQTKSISAFHVKHAPNPDRAALNGPVNPNEQAAQRGFRYYGIRPIGIVPQSFKLEDRLTVQGVWGVGSVMMNVTGEYLDDGPEKIVHVRPHDLIVLNPTITTMTEQLFEYNPTGPQILNYKIKGVDYLSDDKVEYQEGSDFSVQDGKIVWLESGRKPLFKDGQGTVLTCVYYITPIYIVQNLPHMLRIIPSNVLGHGALPRDAVYAPQLLVCRPSTISEPNEILNWFDLPNYPEYPDSSNTTGGSI